MLDIHIRQQRLRHFYFITVPQRAHHYLPLATLILVYVKFFCLYNVQYFIVK